MAKKRTPLETPIWNEAWEPSSTLQKLNGHYSLTEEIVYIIGMEEYIQQEHEKKLLLLAERYGLDTSQSDVWKKLCIELAKKSVVGFKVASRHTKNKARHTGRSTTWTPRLRGLLWVDVEMLRRRQRKISVVAALRALLKREPWRTLLQAQQLRDDDAEGKVRALNQQYLMSKKSEIVRSILAELADISADDMENNLRSIRSLLAEAPTTLSSSVYN